MCCDISGVLKNGSRLKMAQFEPTSPIHHIATRRKKVATADDIRPNDIRIESFSKSRNFTERKEKKTKKSFEGISLFL